MNNLLQEFENLQPKKSKIILTIIFLYAAICMTIISFLLWAIYRSFIYDDSDLNIGVYFLSVVLILFSTTLYLLTKNKKSGWFFLAVITSILWCISAKIVFFILNATWESVSNLNTILISFVLVASSVILTLLYLPRTLKTYKIDETVITISIIINLLTIWVTLIYFE